MKDSPKVLLIFRPIFWLAVIVLYMIIGGAIFHAIETRQVIDYGGVIPPSNFTSVKRSLAEKYNLSKDAMDEIHKEIRKEEMNHKVYRIQNLSYNNDMWGFLNACLYAMTIFTTTGYGALIAETILGKVLTCVYATVGIPLFIKFVLISGEAINQIYLIIAKKILPSNQPCLIIGAKVMLSSLLMAIFLCLSAGYHTLGSGWDFRTGFYFSYITFTTIGFGDLIYTADTLQGRTDNPKLLLIGHMILVLVGFALLGALIRSAWDIIQAHHTKRVPRHETSKARCSKKNSDKEKKTNEIA